MKCCIVFIVLFLFNQSVVNASIQKSYIKDNNEILNKLLLYKIHNKNCNNLLNRLVLIENLEYYDFSGNIRNDGQIIVLDSIAENIIQLFNELKNVEFPIYGINPFLGVTIQKHFYFFKKIEIDDNYNYTASYSCRNIQNSTGRSIHSFGLAIDINPLHNPYIGIDVKNKKITKIIPKNGILFLNTLKNRPNKPTLESKIDTNIINIFQKHGFHIWGGNWDFPIDGHHFQTSSQISEILITLNTDDAKQFFQKNIQYIQKYNKSIMESETLQKNDILQLYKEDKKKFWELINSII